MREERKKGCVNRAYLRAIRRVPSSAYRVAIVSACLIIATVGVIADVSGWLVDLVPDKYHQWVSSASIVLGVLSFTLGVYWVFWYYADVILLRLAVSRLRYGDFEFLAFVILDRPVKNSSLLQEPGILYLFGHLLRRIGDIQKGDQLIDRAINDKPSLVEIPLAKNPALSPLQEQVIASGISDIVSHNILLRIWYNRRWRFVIIGLALLMLILFFVMQLTLMIVDFSRAIGVTHSSGNG